MQENDKYTREEDKRFTLRMDKGLFERISSIAKKNRRSVAKEVELAIEMYVEYSENNVEEDRIGYRE